MNKRSFIFYPEWLDCANGFAQEEERVELLKMIVDYGCTGIQHESASEALTAIFNSLIKPKIDLAQAKYGEKMESAKLGGKKKKVDEDAILEMALKGFTAKQIAAELGISTTAVYHTDAWKLRKG